VTFRPPQLHSSVGVLDAVNRLLLAVVEHYRIYLQNPFPIAYLSKISETHCISSLTGISCIVDAHTILQHGLLPSERARTQQTRIVLGLRLRVKCYLVNRSRISNLATSDIRSHEKTGQFLSSGLVRDDLSSGVRQRLLRIHGRSFACAS
jgi:hypothetical protein